MKDWKIRLQKNQRIVAKICFPPSTPDKNIFLRIPKRFLKRQFLMCFFVSLSTSLWERDIATWQAQKKSLWVFHCEFQCRFQRRCSLWQAIWSKFQMRAKDKCRIARSRLSVLWKISQIQSLARPVVKNLEAKKIRFLKRRGKQKKKRSVVLLLVVVARNTHCFLSARVKK